MRQSVAERPLSPLFQNVFGTLLGRRKAIEAVNPDLRSIAVLLPNFVRPWTRNVLQAALKRMKPKIPEGMRVATYHVPATDTGPSIRLLAFDRGETAGIRPALIWMHGGGYVIGTPEQDLDLMRILLDRLDVTIISIDYRLAPEHPFPAPLDDCHDAFCWIVAHADKLGIDPDRLIVGGQSAGGGLAAALVQRAVDSGPVQPVFQLLVYPMLDAMTVARSDHAGTGWFMWTPASNQFGWKSYLGSDPRSGHYPAYAVPATRGDLRGMPPAWIGVGTLDLFYAENRSYAERLNEAGVACELYIEEGAYHGFDLVCPTATATKRFYGSMLSALEGAIA